MDDLRRWMNAVQPLREYTSTFKSGRFASFYAQVKQEAGMMFGLPDDEDNELTPACVRQWITHHRALFRRQHIMVYRAMALDDAKLAALQPGAELGQHWAFELRTDNFGGFDIGKPTSVIVFTATIDARDVNFPLSVAYNCLFPHENELFLDIRAKPVIRSVRRYDFNTDQFGEEERPDLIGQAMTV